MFYERFLSQGFMLSDRQWLFLNKLMKIPNKESNAKAVNRILGLYNAKKCDDVALDTFIADLVKRCQILKPYRLMIINLNFINQIDFYDTIQYIILERNL